MPLAEVIRMALSALRTNKLRSGLTILGVTIGVFSVIGVMTALSVIQSSIESGLSFLGSNIFQFAKYPTMSTSDPEDTFANRRNITLEEGREFERRSEEHTSELQSPCNLVCRLLIEKQKKRQRYRLKTKFLSTCSYLYNTI